MPTTRKRRLEPRKKPRQSRSQATVDAILAAAARVFAVSGYAATTTNHIARRAGVSIGSLYEYFPGKDAILAALTERHVDEAERELSRLLVALGSEQVSLADLVERLVRAMVGLHAHDPGLHRVLFEQAPLPAPLLGRVARLEEAMAAQVARLLERHGLPRGDAATAARMGVEVLESLTHRLVVHRPGADAAWVEAQVAEIAVLLLGYLEAKHARSAGKRGAGRGPGARGQTQKDCLRAKTGVVATPRWVVVG